MNNQTNKIELKFTIHLEIDDDNSPDLEHLLYYWEEHICNDNLIDLINSENIDGKCNTCWRSDVEVTKINGFTLDEFKKQDG